MWWTMSIDRQSQLPLVLGWFPWFLYRVSQKKLTLVVLIKLDHHISGAISNAYINLDQLKSAKQYLTLSLRLPEQNSWHLGHHVYNKVQTRSTKSFFHTCVERSKGQKPQVEKSSVLIKNKAHLLYSVSSFCITFSTWLLS